MMKSSVCIPRKLYESLLEMCHRRGLQHCKICGQTSRVGREEQHYPHCLYRRLLECRKEDIDGLSE